MSKKKAISELLNYIDFRQILEYRYQKHLEFLTLELQKLIDDLNDGCEDNFRVCEVGDETYESIFKMMEKQGCCGSFDTIVTAPDGTEFKIGFNYGH